MEASTMRNLVGVLAIILTFLLLVPGYAPAEEKIYPKMYGMEVQFGGGFHMMTDVNDFLPDEAFINYPGTDEDKINIGIHFGIGFSFRNNPGVVDEPLPLFIPFWAPFLGQPNSFGWVFGYNRFNAGIPGAIEGKYRANAFIPGAGAESWVEQTISGSEFYIMPTWYWGWKDKEIFMSVGPAVYHASLDRSISITRSVGSGANPAGSFDGAIGTALGAMYVIGIEIPVSEDYYLSIKGGGRLANVTKLTYEDNQDVEHTVWKNAASNATLGVDFSGAFINFAVRTYFGPSSKWRSPERK